MTPDLSYTTKIGGRKKRRAKTNKGDGKISTYIHVSHVCYSFSTRNICDEWMMNDDDSLTRDSVRKYLEVYIRSIYI